MEDYLNLIWGDGSVLGGKLDGFVQCLLADGRIEVVDIECYETAASVGRASFIKPVHDRACAFPLVNCCGVD